MRIAGRVKSISYLKAHAAEVLREIAETREPMVITQNGEAAAVLLSAHEYDALMERLALLQMLEQSERSMRAGEGVSLEEAAAAIRARTGAGGDAG